MRHWLGSAAIHSVPVGVVIQDMSGSCIYANPLAEEALGSGAEAIVGRSSGDSGWGAVDERGAELPEDLHPSTVCLRSGRPVHGCIMGIRRPDGDLRWLRVDAVPLHDPAGRVRAVQSSFVDVTEERRLRSELAVSEGRLARTRRASRVNLWEWHLPTDTVRFHDGVDERTQPRCGSASDEWLRSIHPDDRARVAGCLGDAVSLDWPFELSYRMVDPRGAERALITFADVLEADAAGNPVVIGGSVVDVTATESANAQAMRLLDRMSDGYFTLTRGWVISYLNEQAAVFLERRREELVGAHLWTEFADAVGTEFETHYQAAMGGEEIEFESYYGGLDMWFEVRAHPICDGIAVYFRDVTERRRQADERERLLRESQRARAELAHAARHDPLTGLPNRVAFTDWLRAGLRRRSGAMTLLVLDLDRFKRVNDSHGHQAGDTLLVHAASRLSALAPASGMVARLAGDDFIIGLPAEREGDVSCFVERVLNAFRAPFEVRQQQLLVTVSIGIAGALEGATSETLLRDAGHALHQAKQAGRNCATAFDETLRKRVETGLAVESDLRRALRRRELGPHYQPIFDARTGAAVGVEALARWSKPDGTSVPPATFIPIAEETGMVMALGEAITDAVTRDHGALNAALDAPNGTAWINISTRQLDDPSFATAYVERVRDADLIGGVGVEITETALARDNGIVETAVRELAAAGIPIAIDDFGTGYSSLARLLSFQVHMLKIDRSFVESLASETGAAVVAATIDLGHALGAKVCAEGVETAEQLATLCRLGVDTVSGYYLCRPAPLAELASGAAGGRQRLADHRAAALLGVR